MRDSIIRFGYIIVGYVMGLVAGIMLTNQVTMHRNFLIITSVVIGIIFSLSISKLIKTDKQKIFYLILMFLFIYPLSYLHQYIIAMIIFIVKILYAFLRVWF